MSEIGFCASAVAKINLFLQVLGRRADGFHDIRSLSIGVGLEDDVVCAPGSSPGVEVETDEPLVQGSDNLAAVAARALARECGIDAKICIKLAKRIPIGGGLGGGSSDAATTLRLCNRLWRSGLGDSHLESVGAKIGSDVPLFFRLPCVRMEGRGERVSREKSVWSGWVVLIDTGVKVFTPQIYGRWKPHGGEKADPDLVEQVINAKSAGELMRLACNDLEACVFEVAPEVRHKHQRLERGGLGPLRVSGAGGVLFRLMDDFESARRYSDEVKALLEDVTTWVVPAPVQSGGIELVQAGSGFP